MVRNTFLAAALALGLLTACDNKAAHGDADHDGDTATVQQTGPTAGDHLEAAGDSLGGSGGSGDTAGTHNNMGNGGAGTGNNNGGGSTGGDDHQGASGAGLGR